MATEHCVLLDRSHVAVTLGSSRGMGGCVWEDYSVRQHPRGMEQVKGIKETLEVGGTKTTKKEEYCRF